MVYTCTHNTYIFNTGVKLKFNLTAPILFFFFHPLLNSQSGLEKEILFGMIFFLVKTSEQARKVKA